MNLLVSVIVPAYNCSKTICETLESIVNQTYKNIECIVVDDGSLDTEKLEEIVSSYYAIIKDLKLYKKENGGVSSARNFGAYKAKGSFFIFLDADDKILDTYIEKCLNEFEKDPTLCFVCTNAQEFERSNNKIKHKKTELNNFILHNPIFPCVALIRSSHFKAINGYDERLKVCEDWDLYISLLENNPNYYIIDEYLYFYRKRNDQSSLTDQIDKKIISMNEALFLILQKHKETYDNLTLNPFDVRCRNNKLIKKSKFYIRKVIFISAFYLLCLCGLFLLNLNLKYLIFLNLFFTILYIYIYKVIKKIFDGYYI